MRITGRRQPIRSAVATAGALLLVTLVAGVSLADEDAVPTEQEIAGAEQAATAKAGDVASVQAQLVLANEELRRSAVTAGQAAESFNGARWRLQRAQEAVRAAEQRAQVADADQSRQRAAYAETLATSYQLSPQLRTLSAIVSADGIKGVLDQTYTLANAESAMQDRYDAYRAATTLAEVASTQAETARTEAAVAAAEAREARDAARAAEAAAAATSVSIAARKEQLIRELADLQDISVALAEQRQSALEAQAAEAAAAAAQEDDQSSGTPGPTPDPEPTPDPDPSPDPEPTPDPDPEPAPDPEPTPDPDPEPAPDPDPPAPAAGAAAAISFAQAQLGEPYRWGAAGPDAWDCSGLTMGAWGAGGTSLPHYSVAQYQQSTRISVSQLRPGDLVFWGSSSSSTSIYHVALYIGDGQIIHAPRTGRPVTRESMYYWIAPTFFARP